MDGGRSCQRRASVSREERVSSMAGGITVGRAHDDRRHDREGRLVRRPTWEPEYLQKESTVTREPAGISCRSYGGCSKTVGLYRPVTVSRTTVLPTTQQYEKHQCLVSPAPAATADRSPSDSLR